MGNKRYSIVRVDNHCPEGLYENIKPNILCPKDGDCEKCKHGDTKEQLVQKVYQELTRQVYKNNFRLKDIATKIVEFLGVEE